MTLFNSDTAGMIERSIHARNTQRLRARFKHFYPLLLTALALVRGFCVKRVCVSPSSSSGSSDWVSLFFYGPITCRYSSNRLSVWQGKESIPSAPTPHRAPPRNSCNAHAHWGRRASARDAGCQVGLRRLSPADGEWPAAPISLSHSQINTSSHGLYRCIAMVLINDIKLYMPPAYYSSH
jgi:hypothetical protein